MFDIGFWELLVIAVVLLLVLGPERLPEVAKQAAFWVRKMRQGMYRLRNEMQSELNDTPFSDLQKARQEMNDFKNDVKQLGRELADSVEEKAGAEDQIDVADKPSQDKAASQDSLNEVESAPDAAEVEVAQGKQSRKELDRPASHRKAGKKAAKKASKKVVKKASKKVSKKAANTSDTKTPTSKKKVTKKKITKKKIAKKKITKKPVNKVQASPTSE